jgi:sugar phosphate isomerase/epimerase
MLPKNTPFPVSGIADEAADEIHGQIAAHLELGWRHIELRLIGGKSASTPLLPDADFEAAMGAIETAGLKVTAFSSAIGNWSRPITGDFEQDLADLRVLTKRMKRAGTRFVRTMSWVRGDVALDAWRDEGIRRYQIMARIAEEADILLLHENCEGWAGLSAENTCEFIERVNHPNVGVLFDIGNTAAYGQDSWAFYQKVRPLIRYVHIKDCRRNPAGGKSNEFTLPGEGDSAMREILTDLIRNGYRAGISIEPHVASIIHLGAAQASPEVRRESYVRYGRTLETLLASILPPA